MSRTPKILVCPLDWGLGHATRCIPIIRSLIERGAEIYIASSGSALDLLKIEFPTNVFFELPSYNPLYAHGNSLAGQMLLQLPKFSKVIAAEHRLTEEFIRKNDIDIVISDNRYGCYAAGIESILVTHQPNVVLPNGYGWATPGINWILRRQIGNFNRVWIPDQPDSQLTALFNSTALANRHYIGWLSRFEAKPGVNTLYKIAAIISGPEPQRTILEKVIRREFAESKVEGVIVRGQPGPTSRAVEDNVTVFNHLPALELQRVIQEAELVVSRSGYSTIMDLIALRKNAIFIPTPGQPEQNILADYLNKNRYVVARSQDEFELTEAIQASLSYKGLSSFNMDKSYLTAALDSIF